ncbi:MAG: SRPBCC domain-containing protein [Phycisphaera sp.]|nr:MAG: SRPBCC domain-containing protein [Phycisphaera sp.]
MMTTKTYAYEGTHMLPGAASEAFDALTTPAKLRVWFCEYAEVEPEIGGAFRFWGKHTPFDAGEAGADQRISGIAPGERLAFTWTWGGAPTRVTIELKDAAEGCEVLIKHEADTEVAGHLARDMVYLMDDLWVLSMGNLCEFMQTGQPALLPDHAKKGDDVFLSLEIDAPSSLVWKSLTEPGELNKWLARDASVELSEGGEYSYGWEESDDSCGCVGPTKVLELEPERLLIHDWTYEGDSTNRTEWRIEPLVGDRCRVSVRQVGIKTDKERGGYTNGWAKFLLALRELCTSGA